MRSCVAGGALVIRLARSSEVRVLGSRDGWRRPLPAARSARFHAASAQKEATASNKGPAAAAERVRAGADTGDAPGRPGGIARLRAGARRRRNAAGAAAAVDTREQAVESSEDEADGAEARAAGPEAAQNERGGAQPAVSGKVAREEKRQEKERLKEALREQQEHKVSFWPRPALCRVPGCVRVVSTSLTHSACTCASGRRGACGRSRGC